LAALSEGKTVLRLMLFLGPLKNFGFEVGVWSAKKRVMFVAETKKGL
jgi:hypothetical protein